jgi:undecaprenyl-diphosphatase
MTLLLHLNYLLFQKINGEAGDYAFLDTIMVFCANLLIFFWPLVLLALWGRPVSWRKRSLRHGEQEIIQECRSVVLWVGLACLFAYSMNLLIEQFVFEPRLFVTHKVHLLVSHVADGSFPSDHTA